VTGPQDSTPTSAPADDTARVRRRVNPGEGADPGRQGRGGCLLTGAILGIIVGATFAFYGLPPILKHFYGEKHIAAGQTYTGDAKSIAVASVVRGDTTRFAKTDPGADFWYVTLTITTNKTWAPKVSDFSLQFDGVSDWIEAVGAPAGSPTDTLAFALAEERTVQLRFPLSPGADPDAAPHYIHVAEPRVRLALK
jgi:hypothetical protein